MLGQRSQWGHGRSGVFHRFPAWLAGSSRRCFAYIIKEVFTAGLMKAALVREPPQVAAGGRRQKLQPGGDGPSRAGQARQGWISPLPLHCRHHAPVVPHPRAFATLPRAGVTLLVPGGRRTLEERGKDSLPLKK